MPTLLNIDGFRIRTYPNDHFPAHVHVIKDGGLIVINLNDEGIDPTARESHDMKRSVERRAKEIVTENKPALLAGWRQWHGE